MHREQFEALDIAYAFKRVIALVVQFGVEFGDSNVYSYNASNAHGLASVLKQRPAFFFEAHSTDYQTQSSLMQLRDDGYGIQKVGQWLTYAYREALYSLDAIAAALAQINDSHYHCRERHYRCSAIGSCALSCVGTIISEVNRSRLAEGP